MIDVLSFITKEDIADLEGVPVIGGIAADQKKLAKCKYLLLMNRNSEKGDLAFVGKISSFTKSGPHARVTIFLSHYRIFKLSTDVNSHSLNPVTYLDSAGMLSWFYDAEFKLCNPLPHVTQTQMPASCELAIRAFKMELAKMMGMQPDNLTIEVKITV